MALLATGVNLAWCLVSYRVALSRMASSILFVHILTGLASSIVASISLGPLVTPRLTLSYLATLRLRHLQLLILAGGSVFGGTKTMVAMRGDCFYSDGPPLLKVGGLKISVAPVLYCVSPSILPWFMVYGCVLPWPATTSLWLSMQSVFPPVILTPISGIFNWRGYTILVKSITYRTELFFVLFSHYIYRSGGPRRLFLGM